MKPAKQHFLIVNPFGIGDVLFSTPLISALKSWSPEVRVSYLCNARTHEMLRNDPRLDCIIVYEKDDFRRALKANPFRFLRMVWLFLKNLRRGRFDIAIDLSLAQEFGFVLMLSGVRQRIGLDYKGRGSFLTHRIPFHGFDDYPISEYYLKVLRCIDVPVSSEKTAICTAREDEEYANDFIEKSGLSERPIIGLAPGGGAAFGGNKANYKRWGAERFGELVDLLTSCLDVNIVLFAGPGERELADLIKKKHPGRLVVCEDSSVTQMASLMKRCAAVVANDGGPLHVAVAAGVATVSVFGPTDYRVYGPYPSDITKHKVITQPVACSPCYRRFKLPECTDNVCLRWISPSVVAEAVSKIVNIPVRSHLPT